MTEPIVDRRFLERLERLTLHWEKSFNGLVGGHNLSRFSGPGQEFLDHRNFHQGDDLRSVKASRRKEIKFIGGDVKTIGVHADVRIITQTLCVYQCTSCDSCYAAVVLGSVSPVILNRDLVHSP